VLLLRLTILAFGFAFALAPAAAADAPRYCGSVAAKLKADSDLAAAARASFGEPQATDDEACLYPLQLLRYADVDVLVSQTGEPGEACHGCEASLSATVLKRVPGGYKRARSFDAFAKGGTFGDDEFGAVVGTYIGQNPAHQDQIGQRLEHVHRVEPALDEDRQRLSRELVDAAEHAELPPVVGPILDEVVGPDVIGAFRAQADAGSVRLPKPASLRLPGRDFQPPHRQIRSTRLSSTIQPAPVRDISAIFR
jgi:hypothetical protein